MRGRRSERLGSRVGTRYNVRSAGCAEPLSGGAHNSLRVPRPDPPLLPSIIFPLGPPFCGDECRAERALGCGGIFPRDQQAGARVRKRRREGNEWAAGVERRYTIQRTIRWLKNRCQVGPTILFECPAQIPRSSLRSFSLWAQPSSFSFPQIIRCLVIGILYVIASAFKRLYRISCEIEQPTGRCDKCL